MVVNKCRPGTLLHGNIFAVQTPALRVQCPRKTYTASFEFQKTLPTRSAEAIAKSCILNGWLVGIEDALSRNRRSGAQRDALETYSARGSLERLFAFG